MITITKDNGESEVTDSLVAEIISMHARAEHWKSAFEFYQVELRFLRTMMDRYSIWLDDDDQVQQVITSDNRVTILDRKNKRLLKLVSTQLVSLSLQFQEPLPHDIEECRDAAYKIEMLYTEFLKELLPLKKTVLQLTESVLEKRGQSEILSRT